MSAPPVPPSFGVHPSPGTAVQGSRLTGGMPRRRVDLSPDAAAVVRALFDGETVAGAAVRASVDASMAGSVARRLLELGAGAPAPPSTTTGTPSVGSVAAVIPARDAASTIGVAIAGLAGVDEIVVVDDGSMDGTAEAARAAGARIVRQVPARGPAAARNAGIRSCTADVVVLLDSDARPGPGWVGTLLGHLADPAVGGVAPRVLATDDGTLLGGHEAGAGPLDLGPNGAVVRPDGPVPFVPTTALVLRRSLWEELGGFDEALRFGEDLDFTWRAAAVRPIVYEPATVVRHPHRAGLADHLRNRAAYGSAAGSLSRRHPGHPRVAVAPPLLAGAAVAGLAGLPRFAVALAVTGTARTALQLAAAGEPPTAAIRGALGSSQRAGRALAAAVSRPWLPLALAMAAVRPAARPVVAGAVIARLAFGSGRETRPSPTGTALRLLDDLASSAGVLRGCIESSTVAPLTTRHPAGPTWTTSVLGRELTLP